MSVAEPGTVLFDRYRVVRRIAAGGMGTVFEARDLVLDHSVALKRVSYAALPDELAAETRERTLREARNAAQMRGVAHVVAIYDVQVSDDDVWLVLEYLPSRSLAELTAGRTALDVRTVAGVGATVARGLAAAHARGITHRDVKPGNILIASEGGEAKLTDFGISHAEGESTLTATGQVSGTPAYMAREVARGEDATPASDVFSLGATLYAAVEGIGPFGAQSNPRAMVYRVANDPVRPPEQAGPLTPVLMAMMADEPTRRPNAETVAGWLDSVVTQADGGRQAPPAGWAAAPSWSPGPHTPGSSRAPGSVPPGPGSPAPGSGAPDRGPGSADRGPGSPDRGPGSPDRGPGSAGPGVPDRGPGSAGPGSPDRGPGSPARGTPGAWNGVPQPGGPQPYAPAGRAASPPPASSSAAPSFGPPGPPHPNGGPAGTPPGSGPAPSAAAVPASGVEAGPAVEPDRPNGPGPDAPPGPGRSRRTVLVAGAVAAALLAVAAVVGVRALSSDDAPETQAASPRAITGDVRTADPCALLDLPALARFGGAGPSLGVEPGGCRADVVASDGRPAQVTVSYSRGIAVDGGTQQIGDLTVRRGRTGSGGGADARLCKHAIGLPDGNQVLVRAYSFTAGIAPCDLADQALDSAVAALQRDGVRYDPNRNADFSLARADACQTLDAAALGRAGIGATPFPGFASWSCSWGTAENYASVSFGGTTRDTGIAGEEGPSIAGRKSYVEAEQGSCSVTVAHREGPDVDARLETVTTTVQIAGAERDRTCGAATDLATTAEGRVPAT